MRARTPVPLFLALLFALLLGSLPAPPPVAAAGEDAAAYRRYLDAVERHGGDDERTRAALQALRAARPAVAPEGEVAASPDAAAPVEVPLARPPFHAGTERPAAAGSGDNYCGQYALATILPALGLPADFDRIYREMNPAGIFTAPLHFVEYAKRAGAPARAVNGASRDELKAQLAAGRPVALLLSCDGGVQSVHWVAVTGFKEEDGKTYWKVSDSYWGVGRREGFVWMSDEELAEKWDRFLTHPALAAGVSYRNYAVFFDGKSGLAAEHATALEDAVLGGVNDLVAGWKNRRPGQLFAGLVECGGGLLGLPGAAAGRAVRFGGEWLAKRGEALSASGSPLARAGGAALTLAGKATSLVGRGLDFLGRTLAFAGNRIGSLFH